MASRPPRARSAQADENGAIWPWVGVVGLSAVGLALSIYLLQEHYVAWTDPTATAICDFSEALSCSVVARSPYAVFFGLPVAAWGVLGYLAIAAVGFWGWFGRQRGAAVAALGVLAAFATVTSVGLGVISKLAIGVLCPFCMGSYGVTGALAVFALALFVKTGWREAWTGARRFLRAHAARTAQLAGMGALAVGLLAWFYPKYWRVTDPITEQMRSLPAAPPSSSSDSDIATGITSDGHHWIGARNPKVTVTEFSDYECPFCALAHRKLRALIEAHPTVIRVIHRHFPLDQACNPIIDEPFHANACYYAGLSFCAGEQGKFWAANDHLFLHGREAKPVEVPAFASELGLDRATLEKCLEERAWQGLRPDLEAGIRMQLRGTPTFVIDGKVLMGSDPAEILAPYLSGAGSVRATPTQAEPGGSAAAREVAPDSSAGVAASAAPLPVPTASATPGG